MTEITNAGQSTVKTYKYDAFGNILQETGPTVPGGMTYTGRQYHSRSGLYYYRARWYSPQLGRFLTQDPIGHVGGMNLYAYVGNAPVDWLDPLGLSRIVYDGSDGQVYIYPGNEDTLGPPQAFPAANNVKNPAGDPFTPGSYGPAPTGTFQMDKFIRTYGGPNSAYGYGFIRIILPAGPNGRREGVGIHAGRANKKGHQSQTLGCIRSTDGAMRELEKDPPTVITIQE